MKRQFAAPLCILLLVALLNATPARAANRFDPLVQLGLIGLSLEFTENIFQYDRCRTLTEAAIESGGEAALGLVAGIGGTVIGGVIGSEYGMGGALGGAIIGRVIGGSLGRSLGSRAGREQGRNYNASQRDYAEYFEYNACNIILASKIILQPLLERYVQVAVERCDVNALAFEDVSPEQLRQIVACANRESDMARNIILQIIRLNQATCFAIEQLGDAIIQNVANNPRPGESSMPFALDINACQGGNPAQIWDNFVNERLRH